MGAHGRGNAFDFLRITAALAVLLSHSFAFVGLPEPHLPYGESLGTLAVKVFFVISGYLVTASWLRDPNLGRFLFRRVLRIFPGLLVATTFVVLLIGPVATRLSIGDYFGDGLVARYFIDVVGLKPADGLPGVFKENPFPSEVNGSLWSLRYEVAMYLMLAALGLVLRGRSPRVLGGVCIGLVLVAAAVHLYGSVAGSGRLEVPVLWRLDPAQFGYHFDLMRFLGLIVFFFGGALLYLFADQIPLRWTISVALCVLACVLPGALWRYYAAWLAIPYTCIVIAQLAPAVFRGWGRFDYSYGIYIYAFPLQQLLVQWCWPAYSHAWILIASVVATVSCAALSWHLVEKPAMRFRPASRPASA